jgi:hypothetical protein
MRNIEILCLGVQWITKFSKKTYIGKKIWSNLIENKLTLCK